MRPSIDIPFYTLDSCVRHEANYIIGGTQTLEDKTILKKLSTFGIIEPMSNLENMRAVMESLAIGGALLAFAIGFMRFIIDWGGETQRHEKL